MDGRHGGEIFATMGGKKNLKDQEVPHRPSSMSIRGCSRIDKSLSKESPTAVQRTNPK